MKKLLSFVTRPSRYIGGEVNAVKKDLSRVKLKCALAFPDAYEVGMSHLGVQILYQILNSLPEIACERVYVPWTDMEGLMRERAVTLTTLESGIPLRELDFIGFSLQYELCYTNILNMLDLSGIPLYSKDRGKDHPLVIGGGSMAFNPEPVADFFDVFVLGDGEEVVLELAEAIIEEKGKDRKEVLKRLTEIEGVYVPSFFDVSYNPAPASSKQGEDGTIKEIIPLLDGYTRVRKRLVVDLNTLPPPTKPVVPFTRVIHDRLIFEIARGCTR
ncbi:MAG: B12-binding domain-containing radical SAM protein, partial [Deltaproteobacteria bacterium]|nr:B12-binding domain-containing radical SAM protein [Deltaproteobacteria bacterium]